MANITTELNKIANSVYGREMRSALHDAIEKVNDDVNDQMRSLTYEEYRILSPSEKLNGTLYFTSDTKQIFLNGIEYTEDSGVTSMKKGRLLCFSAASAPMDNLEIELRPVQNTNGYGECWAGGRGKNKLQLSISGTDTVNGVTVTVTDDFRVRLNGTATDDISLTIGTFSFSGSGSKDYILNGCPSGGSSTTYRMKINNKYDYGTDTEGTNVTFDAGVSYPVSIMVKNGTALNMVVFKPMLREKGDANFRPYSNVCPIVKNSVVPLRSYGKNIFDRYVADNVNGYIINERGERIAKTGEGYFYGNPIAPSATYTLSGHFMSDSNTMYVYTFDESMNIRRVYGPITYNDLPYTFQAGPLARYFGFSYQDGEFSIGSVQLEVGSKATTKEATNDHTYELAVGSQTWGGQWHVTDGYLDEEWDEIASYNGEELPGEWYSSENTYGVHASPNIGAQVVYKTGSVTRKTTSIIAVSTIKGINTIWGDNNEEIFTTYTNEAWQDIVHYKELLEDDYNAMSEADQNNGVMYFITDKGVIYLNGVVYGASGGGGGGTITRAESIQNRILAGQTNTSFVVEGGSTE